MQTRRLCRDLSTYLERLPGSAGVRVFAGRGAGNAKWPILGQNLGKWPRAGHFAEKRPTLGHSALRTWSGHRGGPTQYYLLS